MHGDAVWQEILYALAAGLFIATAFAVCPGILILLAWATGAWEDEPDGPIYLLGFSTSALMLVLTPVILHGWASIMEQSPSSPIALGLCALLNGVLWAALTLALIFGGWWWIDLVALGGGLLAVMAVSAACEWCRMRRQSQTQAREVEAHRQARDMLVSATEEGTISGIEQALEVCQGYKDLPGGFVVDLRRARSVLKTQIDERTLNLTLHVAAAAVDCTSAAGASLVDCAATNIGGDELAAVRLRADATIGELHDHLAKQLHTTKAMVRLMLPDGKVLARNNAGRVGDLTVLSVARGGRGASLAEDMV